AAKRNINREIEQYIVNAASGTFPGRQVSAYIIGNNTWLNGTSWPLEGVTMEKYHLREGGSLSVNAPTTVVAPDSYLYDPHHTLNYMNNPVKNITWGDYADHSVVTRQADSLVYELPISSSGPGMTLCGQLEVHLNATINCTDTDWVVEVLDHDPVANTSMFLCHGMLRAAFNGSNFVPVTPGAMKEYVFESWPIGAHFKPGHVLQFVVRSSKYPYYAKNSNNGNAYADTTWVVANNTIHHSDVSSSYILLPVV
nr:CocE/NonD family hydrolase C-terminal non-catalytic domain-containing protein [Candidatus Sigynarchaeota archaeon]